MEFHQNVSCRSNDGTKAEERGAAIKGSACARTVGDSEPPAIAAAERKLGHSFACGAGGGLITQLKGVTGDEDTCSFNGSAPRARGCLSSVCSAVCGRPDRPLGVRRDR